MGKLRRRFGQFWKGIARNLETGLHEDRQESLNIVLANELELPNLLQNINAQSVIQRYPLGCRLQVGERVFRYGHLSAAIGWAGRGISVVVTDAGVERGNFLGAQVAGAYTVTWTSVAAIAADHYRGGYLLCQGGFVHKIAHNTAAPAPGTVITLTLYEPFTAIEALPAPRVGLLLENPYANLGNFTNNGAGRAMGVLQSDFTAGRFVWIQTWGPAAHIATPATLGDVEGEIELVKNQVGEECSRAISAAAPGNDEGFQRIGHSWVGGGGINWDTENYLHIWLTIDP